jgi:hypothetical protein
LRALGIGSGGKGFCGRRARDPARVLSRVLAPTETRSGRARTKRELYKSKCDFFKFMTNMPAIVVFNV